MKLFEKQGITDNISSLINNLSNDIIQCANINNENIFFIKKHFVKRNIKITKTKYGYYISFIISSDKENTNISWLNNNTKIVVKCIDCDDYNEYLVKNNKFKNNAKHSLDDVNTSLGIITLNIFRINVFEDEYKMIYSYFNNKILSKDEVSSIIRHELNHMRKQIINDNTFNNEYNNAYADLINLINGNSLISEIAHAFYMICIRDERNAHIEQFYQEYDGKNLSSSSVFIKLSKYEKLIDFLIRRKNDNKFITQIYKYFYHIFSILFGIKSNNETDFFIKLIKYLSSNIDIMKRLIYRAANLYNNENEYINEHKFVRYYL